MLCKFCRACASFLRMERRCDNCIYTAYCGCCEFAVSTASMGKARDLNAFDRRQIIGARCMTHSISEIVREIGFSPSTLSTVYREYVDVENKTSNRANCKRQLALKERVGDGSTVLYVASEDKHQLILPPSWIRSQLIQAVNGRCNARLTPYGLWEP